MTPKLRFNEIDDPWIQYILGDIMTFKNGINANKENYGSGIKFINVLDIINNNYITNENIIGSVTIEEKEFSKNSIEYGDILFQRSSETRDEVGQANVYLDKSKKSVFGGFVIRGRSTSNYNPIFMNFLLKSNKVRKEITSKSGGSTRYNIGQDSLSQVTLHLPTLPEQKKVADFLSAVDLKIKQLQQKIDLLKEFKRGVMQKIFDREIRFKDDDGNEFPEWEEKKLGDVATFSKGKGISKSDIHENGINSCIRYGELYTEYETIIRRVKSKTNEPIENLVLSKKYDILSPSSGETQLDIATFACVTSEGIALGGDLNIIRTTEYGPFIAYFLNIARKKDVAKLSQGNSVVHLYNSSLKNVKILIPVIQEQKRIVTFLEELETKKNNLNSQLQQSQSFKKGLLQQMFV